jgi:exopolyphosphatase/guanosine-5'-triphosphate,3'-diphosphate pyrophosphatase
MNWSTANCAERALSKRRSSYAALDLGTNNCRLMVAVPRKRGFTVVDTFSRIVRLGEGLVTSGRLSAAAQDRAIDALKQCAEIVARWDVAGLRCVTTEACRLAANGDDFIQRVKAETGLQLQVIGAEREAALAARGCSGLIDKRADEAVIFDIGGGSTELSVVKVSRDARGHPRTQMLDVLSLPFGVVRLSEGHAEGSFDGDPYERVRRDVAAAIGERSAFANAAQRRENHLIGTSGTATSLAALHKGLKRYRRREIDGLWMTRADIRRGVGELTRLGYGGRCAMPCIGQGRADLIMPGCAVLEGILDATGFDRLRVADRGLREGLIEELMEERLAPVPARSSGVDGTAQPAE